MIGMITFRIWCKGEMGQKSYLRSYLEIQFPFLCLFDAIECATRDGSEFMYCEMENENE